MKLTLAKPFLCLSVYRHHQLLFAGNVGYRGARRFFGEIIGLYAQRVQAGLRWCSYARPDLAGLLSWRVVYGPWWYWWELLSVLKNNTVLLFSVSCVPAAPLLIHRVVRCETAHATREQQCTKKLSKACWRVRWRAGNDQNRFLWLKGKRMKGAFGSFS